MLLVSLLFVVMNVGESETKRKLNTVTKEREGLVMKRALRSL